MRQNPIKAIRLKAGLSVYAFASLLGVSVPTVTQAEQGACKNPVAIITSLTGQGFDSEAIREEYGTWRAEHIEENGNKLKGTD